MPSYEYKCTKCDSTKVITRSIHESDPGYSCEACKSPMRQVLNGVSLSFKGGGWAHKE